MHYIENPFKRNIWKPIHKESKLSVKRLGGVNRHNKAFEYCRECPAEESIFCLLCSFQEPSILFFAFFFYYMKADHKHMAASIDRMGEIFIDASYLNKWYSKLFKYNTKSHFFSVKKTMTVQ